MKPPSFPFWLALTCTAFFYAVILPACSLALVLFPVRLKQHGCVLGLEPAPLIGGPFWLKVHVKVVVLHDSDDNNSNKSIHNKFDFVPKNATDLATTRRLLSLQSVPAELRHFSPLGVWKSGKECTAMMISTTTTGQDENCIIKEATKFCCSYENQELNLISNNCWTFAIQLYNHILQYSGEP